MILKKLYEIETRDIEPTHQISYHEWYNRYKWLEQKVKNVILTP